jgi:hypothetical protein
LNKQDIADLALEVFKVWLATGFEPKKQWVLDFASIHGDDRAVLFLTKKVDEWAASSKVNLACEVLQALGFNWSKLALTAMDGFRKHKSKKIREMAQWRLEFTAMYLETDVEQLSEGLKQRN